MTEFLFNSDRTEAILQWDGSMALDEIMDELESQGIIIGVDRAEIAAALEELGAAGDVRVARGKPCVPREPAVVQMENQAGLRSGTVDEETGRMDFRERGGINLVRGGDPIGILYPSTDGAPGVAVDGSPIRPAQPEEANQWPGENVRSEIGPKGTLKLFARSRGVVRIGPKGEIYVTDVFELEGDLDMGSGNIDTPGSVHVQETIRNGFRVHAAQDVHVGAAIENANVKAGKSLIVGAGIFGGEDSSLQAEDLISARFSQNANMRSGGDVILNFDTNSTIEANRRIIATSGEGRLRGGVYFAGECIIAKELGSPNGATTRVQAGMGPKQYRALAFVQNELRRANVKLKRTLALQEEEAAKRGDAPITPEQASTVRSIMKDLRDVGERINELDRERKGLESIQDSDKPISIRVENIVHAGVQIQIGNSHLAIEDTMPGCTFRRDPETEEIRYV
ncbi:MAG: FapA family protein [Planctomycetota bacterium]|nr:FapA family protein [Planctomycetota bacterium]